MFDRLTADDPSSLETLRRLDQVCLDFEAAWRAGRRPRPEEVIAGSPDIPRDLLLRELLRLELHYRRHGDGEPSLSEYLARFPSEAPVVEGLFAVSPRVPGYAILGELGRGGFAVVYLARQAVPNRLVALKMIRRSDEVSDEFIRRFRFDFEAMASLDHPHIVQVYEVGEHEGLPYGCLRYYDGGSLADKLQAGPLPCEDAVRLLIPIALAVHHAHQRGILHRDLKPDNILLDRDGQPHVTDFGLARRMGDEIRVTRAGQLVGTPANMAPEQAEGRPDGVTTATDVYALGTILYEAMAGKPPFRGESVVETLQQIIYQDPVPPRKLNPAVERPLEAICLKCLAKEPSRRYPSAEALALDLNRFLNGERVNAYSYRTLEAVSHLVGGQYEIIRIIGPMGWLYILFAALCLVLYGAQNLVLVMNITEFVVWPVLLAPYPVLFAIFWLRSRRYAASSTIERHNWSFWLGHMLGTLAVMLAARFWPALGEMTAHQRLLTAYPATAAMTGVVLFVQGSVFWGRYYLFGLAFFGLAVLMVLTPQGAPLEFGLLVSLLLGTVGVKLIRLTRQLDKGALEETSSRV